MQKLFLAFIMLVLVISCKNEMPKTRYYRNAETGNILSQAQHDTLKNALYTKVQKLSNVHVEEVLMDSIVSHDSIIQTFRFKVKIGQITEKEKIYNYLSHPIPTASLQTIGGESFDFSTLKNKPTLVNFWFAKCQPCIDEMPVLNQLKAKYAGKVNFISITFENKETAEDFFSTHPFHFTKIVDAEAYIDNLGIQTFPKNIFIDKNGIIRNIEGPIPYTSGKEDMKMSNGEGFERLLDKLLKD